MPDLKENIRRHLMMNHFGKERAITIRDLTVELMPIRSNDREIRQAIRDLNMEGVPVLTTTRFPFGVYYGASSEEVGEYLANLGARMRAILDRMKAVDKIKTKEFLKGQMELFG